MHRHTWLLYMNASQSVMKELCVYMHLTSIHGRLIDSPCMDNYRVDTACNLLHEFDHIQTGLVLAQQDKSQIMHLDDMVMSNCYKVSHPRLISPISSRLPLILQWYFDWLCYIVLDPRVASPMQLPLQQQKWLFLGPFRTTSEGTNNTVNIF